MAHRGGQGFVGHAVDHERDRGAEDDRDVDTFFVHVGQALERIGHAGTAAFDMRREHFAAIRTAAPAASRGEPAFDQQVRIAGTVGHTIGRQMSKLFRHPLRKLTIRLIAVAIGIDD